ncbi:MAG: MATE family efflux transporter [Sphaerochaetaceae bacterium]|jgi:putative MATE family efflux protein|nr:MATE family efflux transporter [Sphaerochaetaceae bacterium]
MNNLTENKMAYRPIGRLMITMALPTMSSMLVQALYNIVDSIFIARSGAEALAALSLAFPVQILMIAMGAGTSVGVNSLLSRRLGEKRRSEAESVATNGLFLAGAMWILFALSGFLFSPLFFKLFTVDASIATMGVVYVRICTMASLGIFTQFIIERIMQATGDTIRPMITQMSGAIINIILDPIMIFGLLGFPKMGIAGAALATVIGQTFGMLLGLFFLHRNTDHVTVKLKNIKPSLPVIKEIYRVGFPAIIMQSIGSLMTVGMNTILITFSTIAVSVFGVYFRLQSFIFMPVFGITIAMIPIVGFNYGARNPQRISKAVKTATFMAFGIMAAGLIVFQMIPEVLLRWFDATDEMMAVGIKALRIISYHFPLAAIAIVLSSSFQAMGKGFLSLILSIVRQLGVLLPFAYLLSRIGGLDAIWFTFIISEVVSITMASVMYARVYNTKIKVLEPVHKLNRK